MAARFFRLDCPQASLSLFRSSFLPTRFLSFPTLARLSSSVRFPPLAAPVSDGGWRRSGTRLEVKAVPARINKFPTTLKLMQRSGPVRVHLG